MFPDFSLNAGETTASLFKGFTVPLVGKKIVISHHPTLMGLYFWLSGVFRDVKPGKAV